MTGDKVLGESGYRGSKSVEGKGKPRSPNPLTTLPPEQGGPKGPEPTRYGDWEIGGKCVDF